MIETPGQVLRKTREAKKILIQKVADDTHVSSRHIQALEEDDFSVFPGETYTIGFLKTYATYLGIDTDHILHLYRSSQLEQVEVPLKELTKPTTTSMDYVLKYFKLISIPLALLLVGLVAFLLYNRTPVPRNERVVKQNPSNLEDFLSQSSTIPDTETDHILARNGYVSAVIQTGKGINFSLLNTEIYIVLKRIDYRKDVGGQSSALVELYPGKSKLNLYENQTVTVADENIPHQFKLTLQGATPNNIKVRIEFDKAVINAAKKETEDPGITQARITNPSNYIIRFEGITTGQTFVEFYVDGQPQKKGLLPKGSRILYEANESIQLKIGSAGAMKIKINGKDYNFGPLGTSVKKVILKEKDPLQQTKFKVVVKDA